MANKIYLYQDIYLYPGTYDRYTNLSKLYGRSGIYFEAKGEYSSDIGGYEYITRGPYNYTDTIYVPSSYTEMDTTYWVDMVLEPSMEFSSCSLSGYDKNGNEMSYYFYEGVKVSIYYLEGDSPEESPDLEQLSLVGRYYLSAGEPYLYGPTHNDMEEGATYYITFIAESGITNSLNLKPFVYHEMEGEDYYPGVYPIRFDFGDGYIRCEVSSDYGLVELYKLKSTDPEDPETPSASVTASITLNATTGVATWSYSASSSDISFNEPYVQLWDLNDQIMDPIQIADSSYDFSSYMTSGQTYYATLRVSYYNDNHTISDEVTARSQEVIYSPSSPDPDPEEPTERKASFNARMTAVANAVRSKASVSGNLSLVKMIDTLNALNSTTGKSEGTYDKTNFDVCMSQLAKVIRTKGGTTAKLTLEKMPAAIAAIQLAPSTNYQWLLYDSQWGKYDLNNLPDYISAPHYNGDCAYCGTTLYFYNSYFNEYCPECNAYLRFMDGGTELINPPSGDDGWQYNELWYYMGDWYTQNPVEGSEWQAITCSKCGATCYSDSVVAESNCANVDSVGNACNNWLSWTERETYGVCHVSLEYLGDYCNYEGPYDLGCPTHGFANWTTRDY